MSRLVNPTYTVPGTASQYYTVLVEDIDPDNHLAMCRSKNSTFKVSTLLLPGKDAPLVGEKWIIERKFGQWLFSYYVVDLTT